MGNMICPPVLIELYLKKTHTQKTQLKHVMAIFLIAICEAGL